MNVYVKKKKRKKGDVVKGTNFSQKATIYLDKG